MLGMPFEGLVPSVSLVSSALDLEWSAYVDNNLSIQGIWLQENHDLCINVREFKAVHLTCKVFLPYMAGRVVQVLMDNIVMMFYIKRQGPCQEGMHLWNFAIRNNIHIMASHLPRARNIIVDFLSRSFLPRHEWSLHSEVANMIFGKWGSPQVDLFASNLNKKCHQFCSIHRLNEDSLSDAFLYGQALMYAFPAILLVHKVLYQILL